MTTNTTQKRDVQKLQRAIVDGLEDVKAQEIKVFDTSHLSPLFERVIIASGTSNRQTKALSASVIDAVREAGFPKPRVEGEGNGEWIIVDCGQAVVHVMQPNFRTYYQLEELWGEKPVRLKLGADKPEAPAKAAAVKVTDKAPVSLRRSSAAKTGVAAAFPSKAQLKKQQEASTPGTKKAATKKTTIATKRSSATTKSAPAAPIKTVVVGAARKKPASKAVASAPAARKAPARKAPARKT